MDASLDLLKYIITEEIYEFAKAALENNFFESYVLNNKEIIDLLLTNFQSMAMNDFIANIIVFTNLQNWKKKKIIKLVEEIIPKIPTEHGVLVSRNSVMLLALCSEICQVIGKTHYFI